MMGLPDSMVLYPNPEKKEERRSVWSELFSKYDKTHNADDLTWEASKSFIQEKVITEVLIHQAKDSITNEQKSKCKGKSKKNGTVNKTKESKNFQKSKSKNFSKSGQGSKSKKNIFKKSHQKFKLGCVDEETNQKSNNGRNLKNKKKPSKSSSSNAIDDPLLNVTSIEEQTKLVKNTCNSKSAYICKLYYQNQPVFQSIRKGILISLGILDEANYIDTFNIDESSLPLLIILYEFEMKEDKVELLNLLRQLTGFINLVKIRFNLTDDQINELFNKYRQFLLIFRELAITFLQEPSS